MTAAKDEIHVVAAVLEDTGKHILLCQRPAGKSMAGKWEFPGGKIEAGETPAQALQRELREELGLELRHARQLMKLAHDYPERRVRLDVWRVTAYTGVPKPLENQPLAWVPAGELHRWDLLAADAPIVTALRLPDRYLVTPEPDANHAQFLSKLERTLASGIRLLQFRAPTLQEAAYAKLAKQVIAACRAGGARVLLNAPPKLALELNADGVHFNAARLRALSQPPVFPDKFWFAVSCHDQHEIDHARRVNADFIVLGPVRPTASHPARPAMGWTKFEQLATQAGMPVFAIGGMMVADLERAWLSGGQGIAAISGLWDSVECRKSNVES